MNVHITNIYGFIQDQDLKKKQNLYADAGHALGFKEMGIFNFDVSTDTESELSKRLDGIISSLQFNDLVFVQLPTGNGEHYDNLLINKLRAYNTKICVLLHEQIEYEYILNSVDLIMPISNEVYAYLKERNYSNVFYKHNINYEFSINSKSSSILSSDFYIKKYLIDAVDQLEESVVVNIQNAQVFGSGYPMYRASGNPVQSLSVLLCQYYLFNLLIHQKYVTIIGKDLNFILTTNKQIDFWHKNAKIDDQGILVSVRNQIYSFIFPLSADILPDDIDAIFHLIQTEGHFVFYHPDSL